MEYIRTQSLNGTVSQWVGTELVMIIDTVTGKPARFGRNNAIGTLEEALEFVREQQSYLTRVVIVKLDCIAPFVIGE